MLETCNVVVDGVCHLEFLGEGLVQSCSCLIQRSWMRACDIETPCKPLFSLTSPAPLPACTYWFLTGNRGIDYVGTIQGIGIIFLCSLIRASKS